MANTKQLFYLSLDNEVGILLSAFALDISWFDTSTRRAAVTETPVRDTCSCFAV